MSSRIRSNKPSVYIMISASGVHKNKTVPASKQYHSIESVYASYHLLVNSHHGRSALPALIITYVNEKQEPERPNSCSNIYYMPHHAQTQVSMKHVCLIYFDFNKSHNAHSSLCTFDTLWYSCNTFFSISTSEKYCRTNS